MDNFEPTEILQASSTLNFSCPNNSSWPSCLSLGTALVTATFMLIIMLVIVLGNVLVILTINNDHKLRSQRQNWLIVSLATADLLVGLLVMPLTMTYEIYGVWILGDFLCELWLALDVLFVTASILHICVISLDRYWSVTEPLIYSTKRTTTRISIMIGVAWTVSFLICMPPILGCRQLRKPGICSISNEIGYVLYSSLGSFYIPVIILMLVYWRIYVITKHHSRQRLKKTELTDETLCQLAAKFTENGRKEKAIGYRASQTMFVETALTIQKEMFTNLKEVASAENVVVVDCIKGCHSQKCSSGLPTTDECYAPTPRKGNNNNISKMVPSYHVKPVKSKRVTFHKRLFECSSYFVKRTKWTSLLEKVNKNDETKKITDKRRRLLKIKERQATLLLGLILTSFIASWLPFFVLYVLGAFSYEAPEVVFKFFFWLGYCNSGINPVIYTLFNREFKRALCRQLRRQQQLFYNFWEGLC